MTNRITSVHVKPEPEVGRLMLEFINENADFFLYLTPDEARGIAGDLIVASQIAEDRDLTEDLTKHLLITVVGQD